MSLDAEFWEHRYRSNQTGWDIGTSSTPLKVYIETLKDKSISILIPGCGNAYEAEFLVELGFKNITLLDIAPSAVSNMKMRFKGTEVRILLEDFFNHKGAYDLILEQTFFCALDPSLRKNYVRKMAQLLKPNGKLVGVLFNRYFEGGPPFGGHITEYQNLFNPELDIKKMELCYNSIPPRKDAEVFFIAETSAVPH